MSIAVAGFLLGLSLIVAIGPQNALVIRQGVKREGLIVVLAICILSDIFLIFGGTAGVGVIIEKPSCPSGVEVVWCRLPGLVRGFVF